MSEQFTPDSNIVRIDMHLHSVASGSATNWWVRSLGFGLETRESYTEPEDAIRKATAAGMDFVTLTDHETIDGALTLTSHKNFLIGEEVGTQFPEDGSKADILVYGLNSDDHKELQARRSNIYDVVEYLREANLVHVLAHPLFEVGAALTRELIEKRIALFPLWEFINGSRPVQQNLLAQQVAEQATASDIRMLASKHGLPDPLHTRIAGTGGSDDHGGVYPGATWTELPYCSSPADVIEALRAQEVRAGGTHGSVGKMSSTAFRIIANAASEGLQDAKSHPDEDERLPIQRLMPGRKEQVKKVLEYLPILKVLEADQVREFLTNRYEDQLRMSLGDSSDALPVLTIISSLGTLVEAHLAIAPYIGIHGYFGRERSKTRAIRPELLKNPEKDIKVGVFVDNLNGVHGVSTIYRSLNEVQEQVPGGSIQLVQCGGDEVEGAITLKAVTSLALPMYDSKQLGVPSLLDVLDHITEADYDVLHIAAPGPLGLAVMAAGLTLGIPVVGAYHTEFGSYARILSGDSIVAEMVDSVVREFYLRCNILLVPSENSREALVRRGFPAEKIHLLRNGVDSDLFSPTRRDDARTQELGGGKSLLLYVGRVSREKGLRELSHAIIEADRDDVHLVVVGDGPYREEMERMLGDRATFTGFLTGEELAKTYASCDVFVFPSETDTLGRVVTEAQASGLPAVVFGVGGPREAMRGGETGFVVEPGDFQTFMERALWLVDRPTVRAEMSAAASEHSVDLDWKNVFAHMLEIFQATHQDAIENFSLSVAD